MSQNDFPQTVFLGDDGESLAIIDQTKLPGTLEVVRLRELPDIWEAIKVLKVRGAPAIGVAAAYGLYIAALQANRSSYESFLADIQKAKNYLDSSRPTAVNLSWALRRMEKVVLDHPDASVESLLGMLREEADQIHDEDIEVCRAIGENGLTLLSKGDGLLTHCNAGRLAAVEYGTATAPIYVGEEQGYGFRVFCDETRPLLQGMRLTAYELSASGVDTTVICDDMAYSIMRKGWVNAVLVGCDRVAANGDTANKIGTATVALAARRCGIPFYVCAPTSTIDLACPDGQAIPIEERAGTEITDMWYETPFGRDEIKVYNPGFDVTDADDITAFVTELGVVYPPYTASLRMLMEEKQRRRCA